MTVGKFFTDPEQHAFSKIAGEVDLCIDVRSHSKPTLDVVRNYCRRSCSRNRAKA